MNNNKDKVYKEVLGEPNIDKDELEKENKILMDDKTSRQEQSKILNQKIQRIEKTVYFIATGVGVLLAIEIIRFAINIWSDIFK